jgi:AAA15 family ATPase/GTPase
MINSLELRNFKTIRELKVDLAPLTIFVGPNGAGKSSILESIALMAQSLQGLKRLSDSLRGELVDFEDFKTITQKGSESLRLYLGFGVDLAIDDITDTLHKEIEIFKRRKQTAPILSQYLARLKVLERITSRLTKKEKIRIEYRFGLNERTNYRSHKYLLGKTLLLSHSSGKQQEELNFPQNVPLRPYSGDELTFLPSFMIHDFESPLLNRISNLLRNRLEKVYFLSVDRGFIPWIQPVTAGEKAKWVGRKGEHTLEVLAQLMSPKYQDIRLPYELLCEKFGINNVWAGWEFQNYLTSGYRDPLFGSPHKLPSLGYGSKQLLPVIAQLAYANPGSVILIEEPEVSLHPSYQQLLPVLFGKAVQDGKQVILTSHSSYFPLSIGSVLTDYELKGQTTGGLKSYKIKLSVNDIAIYHVTRGKDGASKVERLEIDENGLKAGIPSFIKVEKEILSRFMSKE